MMTEFNPEQTAALVNIFLTSPYSWLDLHNMAGHLFDKSFDSDFYQTYEAVFIGANFFHRFGQSGRFDTIKDITDRITEAADAGHKLQNMATALAVLKEQPMSLRGAYVNDILHQHGVALRDIAPKRLPACTRFWVAAQIACAVIVEHFDAFTPDLCQAARLSVHFNPQSTRLSAKP